MGQDNSIVLDYSENALGGGGGGGSRAETPKSKEINVISPPQTSSKILDKTKGKMTKLNKN